MGPKPVNQESGEASEQSQVGFPSSWTLGGRRVQEVHWEML